MKLHLVPSLASLLWVIGTGRAMPTEAEIGWASTTEVITDPPHPHTPSILSEAAPPGPLDRIWVRVSGY